MSSIKNPLLVVGIGIATVAVLVTAAPWLTLVRFLQTGPIEGLEPVRATSDYLTGCVWALLLTGVVVIWGTLAGMLRPLLLAWLAKVLVVLALMPFFDYSYGLDPDGYYMNASSPGFLWGGLELGEGTSNTQMLTWLHVRWLSSSFNATRLSFALLGLVAIYLCYRSAVAWIGREDHRVFFVFAFTPSVLFWSSILGKDPIAFFGISAYLYGAATWHRHGRLASLAWVAAGVAAAMWIRPWLGPILLVPLAVLGLFGRTSVPARLVSIALAIAGAAVAPSIARMTTNTDDARPAALLETANEMSRSFQVGRSTIEVPEINSYGKLVAFAPLGVFTILFRPLPGEVPSPFGLLAGVENVALLLLAFRAVARSKLAVLRQAPVLWSFAILSMWSAIHAIAVFQNLGTASRLKLQITPLLIGLLLYLGRSRVQLRDAEPVKPNQVPLSTRPTWDAPCAESPEYSPRYTRTLTR